jgi:hypothetical protein
MSAIIPGRGFNRKDPRLKKIKAGEKYVIPVELYVTDGRAKFKGIYECFMINSHGVYFFRNKGGSRCITYRCPEILLMLDHGDLHPSRR